MTIQNTSALPSVISCSADQKKTLETVLPEFIDNIFLYTGRGAYCAFSQVSRECAAITKETTIAIGLKKSVLEVKELFPQEFLAVIGSAEKIAKLPKLPFIYYASAMDKAPTLPLALMKSPVMWGEIQSKEGALCSEKKPFLAFCYIASNYPKTGKIVEIREVKKASICGFFICSTPMSEKTPDVRRHIYIFGDGVTDTIKKIQQLLNRQDIETHHGLIQLDQKEKFLPAQSPSKKRRL
jgi:hypothetical protein